MASYPCVLIMFSASSEARDRNAPTNASQIRLQTSRIGQEHRSDSMSVASKIEFPIGTAGSLHRGSADCVAAHLSIGVTEHHHGQARVVQFARKARRHRQDNVRYVVLDLHQSLPRSRSSIVQRITNNLQ